MYGPTVVECSNCGDEQERGPTDVGPKGMSFCGRCGSKYKYDLRTGNTKILIESNEHLNTRVSIENKIVFGGTI